MKKHIPTILSVIRLCMIPLFAYVFWSQGETAMIRSAILYTAAWLTDILDGYLARRFGWITELGKILDPLADKLMQATAIACLIATGHLPIWLGILFVLKEVTMLIGAILIFRERRGVASSHWYGKMATVILYASVMALFFLPPTVYVRQTVGVIIGGAAVFAVLMYYFREYLPHHAPKKRI